MPLLVRKPSGSGRGGLIGRAPAETVESLNRDVAVLNEAIDGVQIRGISQSSIDTSQRAVDRFRAQEDFDFMAVIYFVTSEQRDAFAEAIKATLEDGQFVNGVKLAKQMGIELPQSPNLKDAAKRSERWRKFV